MPNNYIKIQRHTWDRFLLLWQLIANHEDFVTVQFRPCPSSGNGFSRMLPWIGHAEMLFHSMRQIMSSSMFFRVILRRYFSSSDCWSYSCSHLNSRNEDLYCRTCRWRFSKKHFFIGFCFALEKSFALRRNLLVNVRDRKVMLIYVQRVSLDMGRKCRVTPVHSDLIWWIRCRYQQRKHTPSLGVTVVE